MTEQITTKASSIDGAASALDDGLCVTGTLTGAFSVGTIGPMRSENTDPSGYRLAKKPDGTLVLQGAYFWQEGWNTYGHEWRDIPTVDLETHNAELMGRPLADGPA